MVGHDVQTTLKVAMREEVYRGCAENPACNSKLLEDCSRLCTFWCKAANIPTVVMLYHCCRLQK